MRLIDADELLAELDNIKPDGFKNSVAGIVLCSLIKRSKAVDAVPVVRCMDCVHRRNDVVCPMCHEESYDDDGWTEYETYDDTEDDGFCQYGKRSIDEDDDEVSE